MNIFERASIQKIRYESSRGQLMVEQLWDLPLQSKNGFDLDSVAKQVNQSLKSVTEESFVNINTKTNPEKQKFELMLEIVKHIIAYKVTAADEARKKMLSDVERAKLISILEQKKDDNLKNLSEDEILKRLAELS